MHVVVFTRSTPDTAADVKVGANGAVTWEGDELVVNPWDEYALEEAILQADKTGGKTSVIALGDESHNAALKHALAIGINQAIRVEDANLQAGDSLSYAIAATGAINKLADVDLVIFGRESVDVATDQHIYQTGRKLGWSILSGVSKIIAIDPAAKTIQVEQQFEQGKQIVNSTLPAVISVTKEINEPRYPSFMGIRKASKAEIPVWALADLGIDAPAAATQVTGYDNLPARDASTEMLTGTPAEMAEQLVNRLIEEKIL